jgi:hypothetical protein
MHLPTWSGAALAVLIAGVVVSLLVIWLLWPVECVSTAIGFRPGDPDPNLRMCTRRIGSIAFQDSVRLSAVLWGEATGAVVLVAGAASIWWRQRSRLRSIGGSTR